MMHQRIARTHAASQQEQSASGSMAQRLVRSTEAGRSSEEPEGKLFRDSHFQHDFSQVPVQRNARPTPSKVINNLRLTDDNYSDDNYSNQTGIPTPVLRKMEHFFGQDFSDVRVHANSPAAPGMGAIAYTQGHSLHFAPGQFQPGTLAGQQLLGHELTHVVQQRAGRVQPLVRLKSGVALNEDARLEREADAQGAKAAAVIQRYGSNTPQQTLLTQAYPPGWSDHSLVIQRARTKNLSRGGSSSSLGDDSQQQSTYDNAMALQVIQQGNTLIALAQNALLQQAAQQTAPPPTSQTTGGGQVDEPMEIDGPMQFKRNVIQRAATVTGALNLAAAQAAYGGVVNKALATLNWGNTTAANTSTYAHTIDLNTHPGGAPVGATRPNNWAQFIAITGGNNVYVQGHSLHQDLGGDGNHDNLSPFTHSLNGLHYHRVEKLVLNQTYNQFANYDVDVNYKNNPNIAAQAILDFNTFVGNNLVNANAAMVGAGVITALQGAANLAAAPPAIPPLQVAAAQNWITNYVNATFPSSIDCTVTFINDQGGGIYTATAAQNVNITNDF